MNEPTSFIKLLPLSNAVLFPHIIAPLRIIEPRYQEMIRDSLESDRFIGVALLKNETGLEIFDFICIGSIVSQVQHPDGRFDIMLQGQYRAKIIAELASQKPYKIVRVQILKDKPENPADPAIQAKRAELIKMLKSASPHIVMTNQTPLSVICDLAASLFLRGARSKQQILQELDIVLRATKLMDMIKSSPVYTKLLFPRIIRTSSKPSLN